MNEEQIVQLLREQGIVKGQFGRARRHIFRNLSLREKLSFYRTFLMPSGYDSNPSVYDFVQASPFGFDLRLEAFQILMPALEDLAEGSIVTDGGCGTALDITILAKIFPHLHFSGYDIQSDFIEFGRKRISRLGLSNVALYVADHLDPGEFELNEADLLFMREVTYDKTTQEAFENGLACAAQRVKSGGSFIQLEESAYYDIYGLQLGKLDLEKTNHGIYKIRTFEGGHFRWAKYEKLD